MIDRRHVLALLGSCLASPAFAQAPAMSRPTAYAFSFAGLDGGNLPLAEHAGKPILIVNTASQCGYTPQFAGLQQLWTRYRDRGLLIIGVPSNDFGGQEPGGPGRDQQDRAWRIRRELSRSPPRPTSKGRPRIRSTNGPRTSVPAKAPRWNFHKYLIGRDGLLAAVFSTQIEPTDPRVIAAIEKELR